MQVINLIFCEKVTLVGISFVTPAFKLPTRVVLESSTLFNNHDMNDVWYVAQPSKYRFQHAGVNRVNCFFWSTCFFWSGMTGLTPANDLG